MPPLPVILDHMGFYMFEHANGRFSTAITVGGVQHYARDYKQYVGVAINTAPIEPSEYEFAAAMGW